MVIERLICIIIKIYILKGLKLSNGKCFIKVNVGQIEAKRLKGP